MPEKAKKGRQQIGLMALGALNSIDLNVVYFVLPFLILAENAVQRKMLSRFVTFGNVIILFFKNFCFVS